uniref:Choline transporter-like protein n=1 Tax=Tetranychus urticae TaxID=32264 RepID=A0A158P567_TETUR
MLEKFMRFLNTDAYIMIAVHGQSFLPAAKEAFFFLLRNVVRVAVLDKVADYLLMIGKLGFTLNTAMIKVCIIRGYKEFKSIAGKVLERRSECWGRFEFYWDMSFDRF